MRVDSTLAELNRFKSGTVHRDMMRELVLWKKRAEEEYSICADQRHLGTIQGRIEAVKYMMGLTKLLIEEKEQSIR